MSAFVTHVHTPAVPPDVFGNVLSLLTSVYERNTSCSWLVARSATLFMTRKAALSGEAASSTMNFR